MHEFQSAYVQTDVCVDCGWFEVPARLRPFSPAHWICPKCGGDLKTKRGRYTIRARNLLFGLLGSTQEFVAFTERGKEGTASDASRT